VHSATEPRQATESICGTSPATLPMGLRGADILIYRSVALLAGVALPAIAALNWLMLGAVAWLLLAFNAALLTGALLAWFVSLGGRREVAAMLLIGVLWTAATIYAFESGYGMHSSAILVYLPCLLYTAFFFGLSIASVELILTVAALVVMYFAEERGRLGGAAEFARQGTNVNFLAGVILTCIGTLVVSLVYHRRIERDTAALAAKAEQRRLAMEQARTAQAQLETANARLQALNAELETQGRQHALETVRARRDVDLVYDVIAKDVLGSLPAMRAALEVTDVQTAAHLHREFTRIEMVIGALGDFGNRGEPGLLRTNVDLSALANDHIRELRGLARYARVHFDVDPGMFAPANGEQVAALLRHLVKRACSSCMAELEPLVHVGSGSNDGRAMFFVRDNGPGMDAKQLDTMFRPFGRRDLDNTMDIGIVSARRIAERHGGQLFVESDVGKGTTYFFTLSPF
jgi:signal transduction histidine kinase